MPRSSSSSANAHRVWSKESNNAQHVTSEQEEQRIAAALAAYTPTHNFRRDLLAFCRIVNATPHPKLIPMHSDEEENQGAENAGSANVNVYDLSETESVTIKNWQLDQGNCKGLCFAVALCPKIHSLCLFNVMLDRKQLELICQMVPKTQIQALQLEWNVSVQQHSVTPRADTEVSSQNAAETKEADDAAPTGDDTAAKQDAEPETEEDHSAVYAQLLGANSPLVFLSLRSNGISSAGAAEIAKALKSNTTLQSLNLFQNHIGDEGALAIAHALPQNTVLKSISVASNGISGRGAAALISSITRYEAPPELLKEIEDAEGRIHAEIEHAKKAKKKIDRRTAMMNLGLPIFEVIDGVQYAPGNSILEELFLSGNLEITEPDILAISESLDTFQSKLQTHLRHVKLQRIPSLRPIHQHGHKLSEFIVL